MSSRFYFQKFPRGLTFFRCETSLKELLLASVKLKLFAPFDVPNNPVAFEFMAASIIYISCYFTKFCLLFQSVRPYFSSSNIFGAPPITILYCFSYGYIVLLVLLFGLNPFGIKGNFLVDSN